MSTTVQNPSLLEFGEKPLPGSHRMLQWLAPALLGLCAPIIFMMIAVPDASSALLITGLVVLFSAFLVAAAAYSLSVLVPGSVAGVTLDREHRRMSITRQGMFAAERSMVPFDKIVNIRLASRCDDDGFCTLRPEMVLAGGQLVELPRGTGDTEVASMRRAIGLG